MASVTNILKALDEEIEHLRAVISDHIDQDINLRQQVAFGIESASNDCVKKPPAARACVFFIPLKLKISAKPLLPH
ncbi:hypothetical protein [Halothiobacillus sp.]|uniref:hypothetical protein n=1 Tax=Halothiobacillus sp. TaxID=1891311 RepID=UPI002623E8FF|nr:hypothetical protein [Halothiobacillus sp.]